LTAAKDKPIEIFCDGSCLGNPGPGGWGAILRKAGAEREISGGAGSTTNNRMELAAAVEALKAINKPSRVIVTTDSQYLVKGMTEWMKTWIKKGWRTSGGKPVKNRELWEELNRLASLHQIKWKWIRGHAGHPENERCDRLAMAKALTFKQG
jgi:ribonuclease HI